MPDLVSKVRHLSWKNLFYTFLMGIGKYCKLIRRYGHFLIVEIRWTLQY